jgi:hypothetical protein
VNQIISESSESDLTITFLKYFDYNQQKSWIQLIEIPSGEHDAFSCRMYDHILARN